MSDPRKSDRVQEAFAAMEELLRRAGLHRMTGTAYVRLDLNQGGITNVKIATEESFKPTT